MTFRMSTERVYVFSYFIGIILAGALFLVLPVSWSGPEPLRFIDALFTSTSAVCVTGLIVVDTVLYTQFGKIVILLLIQFGGLGLVTFSTIYIALPRKKLSLVSRGLIKDYYIDSIESNPKKIIRNVLVFTLGLEAIGAVLLYFGFNDGHQGNHVFEAIFHSISAFCNAGFSTFSTNLEGYVSSPIVNFTIMALIVSGGIGFLVIQDVLRLFRRKSKRLAYHSKIALGVTAALILSGAALFFFFEFDGSMKGLDPGTRVMASLFESVTTRTAGFDTISQVRFSMPSVMIAIILMFIGASPASTGGGIKTTTFFVLFMASFRGVDESNASLVFKGRSISPNMIAKALGVLGKAFAILFVSIGLVLFFESGKLAAGSIRFIQVIFEVVSAFGTVGLSMNLTPLLCDASKFAIVLTMFVGRIGLFTMAIPLESKKLERFADFPSAEMMIG